MASPKIFRICQLLTFNLRLSRRRCRLCLLSLLRLAHSIDQIIRKQAIGELTREAVLTRLILREELEQKLVVSTRRLELEQVFRGLLEVLTVERTLTVRNVDQLTERLEDFAIVLFPNDPFVVLVKTTTFTFRGVTYTVPRNAMDDLEVLEALEEDKFITVIRKTIGDAQWKTFKDTSRTADGRRPLTESGFEEFLDAMMKALDPTTAS